MLNAREVAYIVEHSGAALALADEELFDRLPSSHPHADARPTSRRAGTASAFREPEISSLDVAQIAYTSGTESRPRARCSPTSGLLAQYVSCIVAGEYARDGRDAARAAALPLRADALLPHALALPRARRTSSLPAPAPDACSRRSRPHGVTSFFAPPTVWIGLLHDAALRRARLSHADQGLLRRLDHAGGRSRSCSERLPDLRLWNYYGQTEIAPARDRACRPDEQLTKPGSAGRPVLNVETRVVDDDMRDVARGRGRRGRSPLAAADCRLLQRPRGTEAAFAGGWFHSGDLAHDRTRTATSRSSTARRT